MEPSFWRERWQEGRIRFHEGAPNALLTQHAARLPSGARVLVPLCGKTEDMAFLASKGHEVVGIELVEQAIRAFFDEHGLAPEESKDDDVLMLRAKGITLLAGDFFALDERHVGEVGAAYDRASIVALPEAMRPGYVAQLRALLPAEAPILTVSFVYDTSKYGGPPFSVDEAELRAAYGEDARIELVDERPITTGPLHDAGASPRERCWVVTLTGRRSRP